MNKETLNRGLALIGKIEKLEILMDMTKISEADAVIDSFMKCDGVPIRERMDFKKRYGDEARNRLQAVLDGYRQELENL